MPIFEIGYRHWTGKLTNILRRWLYITKTGIVLGFKIKFVRWIVALSYAPILYFGLFFFLAGQLTEALKEEAQESKLRPKELEYKANFIDGMIGLDVAQHSLEHPEEVKNILWTAAFYYYMKSFQIWLIIIIAGLVGAQLISEDIKSKAFLFYYSKPITLFEYFLGKIFVILIFIALVSLIPNIIIYIVSVSFSPSLQTISETIDVLLKIFVCYLFTAIPISLLVLFFSSLTKETRYAIVWWFAFCFLGALFYTIIMAASEDKNMQDWVVISLKSNLRVIMYAVFDIENKLMAFKGESFYEEETGYSTELSAFALVVISLFTFLFTHRKISAPIRI